MLTDVIRKFQRYNPATDRFDVDRGLREYGRLLGVDHSTLSLLYSTPDREPSTFVLQRLAQTFPAAAAELAAALAAPEREAEAVAR